MAHAAPTPPSKPPTEHKPYIPADQEIPEFTPKAILLGSFFGLVFGAVTVYLALRAGLTVSASIPIAVLSIAVFKKLGRSTILENNIVQTIGSAGESIAAGVVFTTPAFLFIAGGKEYFNYLQILTLAAVGGILGVLMMVPMRRALIVKEHGTLPYPEGTACAEVLVAGEKGGAMAQTVFAGFWVAMAYTLLQRVGLFFKETFAFVAGPTATWKNASVAAEATPEYLGVGYIIGPRISGIMVSGSVLAWLGLIPLLSMLVPEETVRAALVKVNRSPDMVTTNPAGAIYWAYIRYIGAGAVAMAGVMTLIRTMPTIVSSIRDSFRDMAAQRAGHGVSTLRTERDMPMTWVLGGSVVLVIVLAMLPNLPTGGFPGNLLMALLILVFGFVFVAVSSRIVGLIGSSSNPISGMTIATLLGTCLIFLSLGMGGDVYQGAALCVGSIVCIAAANAGATSQDLKTGYLVGATPIRQQLGLVIGVLVSVLVIGATMMLLHDAYEPQGGIGGEKLPAPQGTLMATIIKGVLAQDLPWGFIFVGAALALMVQLCGVSGLAWAVGLYLPISTTFPIFIGGAMRWLTDKIRGQKEESEISSGMLFATGLVAGGAISGLIVALTTALGKEPGIVKNVLDTLNVGLEWNVVGILGEHAQWSGLFFFALLCFFLVRRSLRKLEI